MTRTIFIAAALALAVTLPAVPAQALLARTFLSAAGSDSNDCANVATPCRHMAAAFAATTEDGEIYVLDPANYGSLTINHAVSIEGHGWAAIAPVSGQAAITINANPGDKINIIGVVLDGTAVTNTTGIRFNSGGPLTVRDSVIRNFDGDGIDFFAHLAGLIGLYVSNTLVSDNGGDGIHVSPSGTGTTSGVLSHVELVNNAGSGLFVSSATQTINVTITDSVSANNMSAGVNEGSAGTAISTMVRNSTIANNGVGLQTGGTGAIIRVTRSTITGNTVGWGAPSGEILSYSDNNIDGNTNGGNTEPPNPLVYH